MEWELKKKIILAIAVSLAVNTLLTVNAANAAQIGSGNCIQTVDSISGVAVSESGRSCFVAFKSGTRVWTAPANVSSIDYLVVAGGGSGGQRHGGGGGAGGLIKSFNVSITNVTALSISVGTGGASVGGTGFSATGLSGNNSSISKNAGSGSFSTATALGGGGGEAGGAGVQNGGSGGGAQGQTPSSGTAGQGNAGGKGSTGTINGAQNWWSGGGGGAGSNGGDGSATSTTGSGGAGGTGAIWMDTFTTTIATDLGLAQTNQVSGTSVYFSGGGGGAITLSYTPGSGGLGGGGSAVSGNNTGVSGTANSGGGGGGTGCCEGGPTGAGGSGIVIIRYTFDTTAPTFTSSPSFSAAENISTSTAAATIKVSESATVTISSGADAALFNISNSDTVTALIRFKISPDFESPIDSGGNNVYDLVLTATDPSNNAGTQTITITVTDVVDTSSFNSFSLSGALSYRSVVTITANVTVAAKVTFRAKNVIIPGCKNKTASGSGSSFTASCTWKPSVRGAVRITAIAVPTGAGISSSSATPLNVMVGNRSSTRN
jgi:hypothetical protein